MNHPESTIREVAEVVSWKEWGASEDGSKRDRSALLIGGTPFHSLISATTEKLSLR
jgi:hypothetical protein